eukprot:TRINITY_DN14548_c0_g1_i1.p2 TRINITY_DN14548_c0_g1~~TRINITY_DN14548_c0_g1_i1.p2  ORF type:complete len:144 (-),score=18.98 TRINITY_DN14548_c0_g1_i1:537-968(-)
MVCFPVLMFMTFLFTSACSKYVLEENLGHQSAGSMNDTNGERSGMRRLLQQDSPERISLSMDGCIPGVDPDCSDTLDCDDIPLDAAFGCQKYLDLGLCQSLEEQYCKKSCGKCECVDKPVPGIECNDVVSRGLCNDDDIQQVN